MTDRGAAEFHILGKEYRVACQPEQRDELLAAARYLDQKMREIRERGTVIGTDRIAVMAALNMAYDLLQEQHSSGALSRELGPRITTLRDKVDAVLASGKQLEL